MERALGVGGRHSVRLTSRRCPRSRRLPQPRCALARALREEGLQRSGNRPASGTCARTMFSWIVSCLLRLIILGFRRLAAFRASVARRLFCCAGLMCGCLWGLCRLCLCGVEGVGGCGGCAKEREPPSQKMLRVLRGALGHVPPLVRSAQATARPVFQMSVRGMHRVQKRIYPHVSQKAGYSYRKSMMKNMLTSLIEHERIKTTLAKAKELSSLADKMVTRGKRGDLNSHRVAKANVRNRWCLAKLFTSTHAVCPAPPAIVAISMAIL